MGVTVEIAPATRMSDAPPFEGDNRPLFAVHNHDKAPASGRVWLGGICPRPGVRATRAVLKFGSEGRGWLDPIRGIGGGQEGVLSTIG